MSDERGIRVFYPRSKSLQNTVSFPDEAEKDYNLGGMVFEVISSDAVNLIERRVQNMIRLFPSYNEPLSIGSLKEGIDWILCAIDDEDYPIATELFRCDFSKAVIEVGSQIDSFANYNSVGDFLINCYEEYDRKLRSFRDFIFYLASLASGYADEVQLEIVKLFTDEADSYYEIYSKKCSVRNKREVKSIEKVLISDFWSLLIFEYCRMKKTGKAIKLCANCGGYFIPAHRIDTKYCSNPSPQNPSKSCSDIGPQVKHALKRKQDPQLQVLYREYMKYQMRDIRYREAGYNRKVEKNIIELQKARKAYEDYKAFLKQNNDDQ